MEVSNFKINMGSFNLKLKIKTQDSNSDGDKDNWITPLQFSVLAKISERRAQQIFKESVAGATWKGCALDVKILEGQGGKSGVSYRLNVQSLPVDLKEKWSALKKEKSVNKQLVLQPTVQNSQAIKNGGDEWLSTEEFFKLVGEWKSIRSAQRVLKEALLYQKTWKGCQLKVVEVEEVGRGGKALKVYAKSLPVAFQEKWFASKQTEQFIIPVDNGGAIASIDLKDNATFYIGLEPIQKEHIAFKYNLIKDLLNLDRKTLKKAIDIKVQENHYWPSGQIKKIGQASFYRWIKQYKEKGLQGLTRSTRNDAGEKRVIYFSKEFDNWAIGLFDEQQLLTIKEEVEEHIISLWGSGEWRGRQITNSATVLLQTSVEQILNRNLSSSEKEICQVLSELVYKLRLPYSVVGLKKTDAAKFNTIKKPRIKRNKEGLLPNDVWFGDVHPLDIQCKRKDGTIIHARQIAWVDVATNRIFSTFIFFPKKRNVRRLDIAKSFCDAVSQHGLPKILYLDNGKEYTWRAMLEAFEILSKLVHKTDKTFRVKLLDIEAQALLDERLCDYEQGSVIRALKHNPQAKSIEGTFGKLEQNYFSKIRGWIGGDRMNKKVQKVGRPAQSYADSFEQFQRDIELQLRLYHGENQGVETSLLGHSPNSRYQQFVDMGWKPYGVERDALLFAFAEKYESGEKIKRSITAGGVVRYAHDGLGSIYYRSDKLMIYAGERMKLELLVPKHDPRFLFVKKPDGGLVLAEKVQDYKFLDPNGAEEQERMSRVLNAQLSQARLNCSFINNNQITEELIKHADPEPHIDLSQKIETAQTNEMQKALEEFEQTHQQEDISGFKTLEDILWLDESEESE